VRSQIDGIRRVVRHHLQSESESERERERWKDRRTPLQVPDRKQLILVLKYCAAFLSHVATIVIDSTSHVVVPVSIADISRH
jgi:hypothetical protein